jgi:hypothetical protein
LLKNVVLSAAGVDFIFTTGDLDPRAEPGRVPVANLKGGELANFAGDTVAEVADQAHQGIQRVCDSDSLVMGVPCPYRVVSGRGAVTLVSR